MPSPEVVQKALEQIRKRPANHDYFFSKLKSADWIAPLDEAGLFSTPPSAIREADTISFPFWPESQFLARVAEDAPDQVLSVMMKMPETDNVRVHEDLARAAARLPGPLAAKWSKREATWVARQDYLYFLLPETLGELFEHLSNADEVEAALGLARAVLAVRRRDESTRSVRARFDTWNYEQLLRKHYAPILHKSPRQGLHLLLDLLDEALVEEAEGDEDYSWIWRPAIEPHEQNHGHGDLRDLLIDAIRDGAQRTIDSGEEVSLVLEPLVEKKRPVFKRIALHLLLAQPTHHAAKKYACERELFFDERFRHEYSRLLAAVFPFLEPEERLSVLQWIDQGPLHHDTAAELDNDYADPDLARKRKAYWQAQRLHPLRGSLPEGWEQRYQDIVAELGEPEHPDFVSYTTSWVGPTSPKEAAELEAMSADEIAQFLKDWIPQEAWRSPEPEGLGRVLQGVVGKSPERFVSALSAFRNVDPTYARAIVHGLSDAVKQGLSVEWPSVLPYLRWIVDQPRGEAGPSTGKLDHDLHWGWARKAVASLLSVAFEKDLISLSLRDSAWAIVDTVADDPDPTPEDDEKSTMDPATRSINTTRGEALHSVVRYALWVRRGTTDETSASHFDMKAIPEVQRRLEKHLETGVDQSPATRAVFGQWYPWLLLLDASWAEGRSEAIFPDGEAALRDAAWLTYLTFCPAYNEPFRVLRGQYESAVARLGGAEDERAAGWHGRPGERLGEHLMVMVGRGVLAWGDDDELVKRFYSNASVDVCAHAIGFIGRSLRNEKNPVPEEVLLRFRDLWNDLATSVIQATDERQKMLRPFGWWFASGRFDRDWAFRQLAIVVESTGGVEPDFMVMEELSELAREHPRECLDALRALARRDERGWNVLGWKDAARAVLREALSSDATRDDATTLIHELGARGHLQFRDLLSQ